VLLLRPAGGPPNSKPRGPNSLGPAGQDMDSEVRARRRLADARQHAVVQVDCHRRCDARRSRALQFPNVLGLWVHSRKQPERVGCAWSEAVEM
jgi:hypothetical protein